MRPTNHSVDLKMQKVKEYMQRHYRIQRRRHGWGSDTQRPSPYKQHMDTHSRRWNVDCRLQDMYAYMYPQFIRRNAMLTIATTSTGNGTSTDWRSCNMLWCWKSCNVITELIRPSNLANILETYLDCGSDLNITICSSYHDQADTAALDVAYSHMPFLRACCLKRF